MIITAILLMLIPPALPPSGPINGQVQCLFQDNPGAVPASMKFDERAPTYGELPTGAAMQGTQVQFTQFPIDGDKLGYVEFSSNGLITIFAKDGKKVLGQFAHISITHDDSSWMKFSAPTETGEMKQLGTCLGYVRGRAERPIKMTKISTFRVDEVSQ